jgi:hypothetical protein
LGDNARHGLCGPAGAGLVLAAWRSGSKHHECTRFYRKHCLVFEGPMQRKTERQLICRKRKCRNALKASQRPSANNSNLLQNYFGTQSEEHFFKSSPL